MPSINIENAQIKTANVEIKTLTVSGKQVTLSVFRQIPEEKLINIERRETNAELDKYSLNGIPWGCVNYFWDKKIDNTDLYIHVLWQKGKELKRDIILKNSQYIIEDLEMNKYEIYWEKYDIKYLTHYKSLTDKEAEKIFGGDLCAQFDCNLKYIENWKGKDSEEYIKLKNKCEEIKKNYEHKANRIKLEVEEVNKILLPLLDLPQLFIAI